MTGLIYVILIGVWGVVLVPRFLRRHDESKMADQSEALESALNGERLESENYADESERAATWGEYIRGLATVDVGRYAKGLNLQGTGASPAARRRGRILIGLSGVLALSFLGSIAGVLPGVTLVVSSVLLLGYVSAMVYYMRRQESSVALGEATPAEAARAATYDSAVASGVTVDGVRVVGEESHAWEPQRTTLPTYVTKTKASKIPRRIDLTSGWTGADMVAQAREQQASPELETQFDREWAAVEPDADAEIERYASGQDEDEGYYRRAVNE